MLFMHLINLPLYVSIKVNFIVFFTIYFLIFFLLFTTVPPGKPMILGINNLQPVQAGTLQKFKCTSFGGNPLPVLNWYCQNKEASKLQKKLAYIMQRV